jgi:hypothetical protein
VAEPALQGTDADERRRINGVKWTTSKQRRRTKCVENDVDSTSPSTQSIRRRLFTSLLDGFDSTVLLFKPKRRLGHYTSPEGLVAVRFCPGFPCLISCSRT